MDYNFKEIEQNAKKRWSSLDIYRVELDTNKPKCYILDMFPYPSGSGLHVGHPLGYIASDIYARYKRQCGFNVLHPMGYDSFGLPAEQYAIETGQHPTKTTAENIARYRTQLDNIGFCFDWSREVRTSSPKYYKWTQWIFSELFNAWYNPATQKAEPISGLITQLENTGHGTITSAEWKEFDKATQDKILMQFRIAYKNESYVNWCEALGTVLANDEVINGKSERGGHPVERRLMTQWFLRITAYADRLLEGLERVDYPESLKEQQRNWIGRSEGALLEFAIENNTEKITVFTTRPDTIFGVSFMVLAPESALVQKLKTEAQSAEVDAYVQHVAGRSEIERMSDKKISGCFTGAYAVHPFSGKNIPVYISEYVLANYGTGAIMAVPAGDERDYKFAQHFGLEIPSIFENALENEANLDKNALLKNSDFLNGKNAKNAIKIVLEKITELKIGTAKVNYRFRDAGFSRQRYWGEPFPIVHTNNGETKLISELPVDLPEVSKYSPRPDGKGPLANIEEWVNIPDGLRETDTMPGYAGSSWYYLRYADPHNDEEFASRKATDYWNQVDVYIGGAEHAVGHLLYSRMWCKVLFDLGHIGFDEPYKKMINQGMIQGSSRIIYRVKGENKFVSAGLKDQYETDELYADVSLVDDVKLDINAFKKWRNDYADATFELENSVYNCGTRVEKMSKRLYNVVNPDDVIAQYGADTFRMYEMFLGPIELSKPWDTKGIEGVHRFLKKFYRLFYNEHGLAISEEEPTNAELKILHKHLKKIASDIESFSFNTSVAQFMITTNELGALTCNKKSILDPLVISLASFAPHISEEIFADMGNSTSVLDATFPKHDEQYLIENEYTYPVAINGKTRLDKTFALDADAKDIEIEILAMEAVQKYLDGKAVKKFIFVKGRMINLVV
jgi:leucyl-tRNA synthetase